MLLASDLGGTKTAVGLFKRTSGRPELLDTREFPTLDFPGLSAILVSFLQTTGTRPSEIEAACLGVAGPIIKQVVRLSNVPWQVDSREVIATTGIRRLWLLNDVEAMAYAVSALKPEELHTLQTGSYNPDGNMCLLTAGTGLGQAILVRHEGRLLPCPSEGGHADFAARTPREIELLQNLTRRHGRTHTEHIVSGPGLVNLLRFTSQGHSSLLKGHEGDNDDRELPAAITKRGLEVSDPQCVEALHLFLGIFGAAAGNFALQSTATGGVFLGGGIPPKILDAFELPLFLEAFLHKSPMEHMLEQIPIHVILNRRAGLLGAAVYAAAMTR
ncbi:MAG: glucokinase [Luteitalea sp.]|nr:glucokinase [Luteitalea sp.]